MSNPIIQTQRMLFILLATLLMAGCAATTPVAPVAPSAAPAHDTHGGATSTASDELFDARFIDAMIVHHEGAVAMAEEALVEATRPEVRTLAEAILEAQAAEIAQMQTWRATWYPDLPLTDWSQMEMGPMSVAPGDASYDVRFLEAMIPHHEGAIMMAEEALQTSERQPLRTLAEMIIMSQEAEIALMRQWLEEWQ
ncbi:MAG: DUF305 domain-containing protein [Candidatus Viridilinea halotolerans]|uniref:DUF305 domain-containing protein n=1 Tax=Candidatus Viridilinea halotolerans TaxID=2491704 RepID=A0A426TW90_9CHLR|nr:MAG: DUF305 domain-containing protein [Candidatus Viridilinea halotolerans]